MTSADATKGPAGSGRRQPGHRPAAGHLCASITEPGSHRRPAPGSK